MYLSLSLSLSISIYVTSTLYTKYMLVLSVMNLFITPTFSLKFHSYTCTLLQPTRNSYGKLNAVALFWKV